jgi:hypothetical protein
MTATLLLWAVIAQATPTLTVTPVPTQTPPMLPDVLECRVPVGQPHILCCGMLRWSRLGGTLRDYWAPTSCVVVP